MIYFTTFIFTLLLARIAHAVPACVDDVASFQDMFDSIEDTYDPTEDMYDPTEDMYDPTEDTYDSSVDMCIPVYDEEEVMTTTYPVAWNSKYDNPNGVSKSLSCSNLAPKYPHYKNIPNYPLIGAAFNIKGHNSPNCGHCWKLTNPKTHKHIYLTAVDSDKSGFILSKHAYTALGGTSQAEAVQVPHHLYCFGNFLNCCRVLFVLRKRIAKIVKVTTVYLYYLLELLHTCE